MDPQSSDPQSGLSLKNVSTDSHISLNFPAFKSPDMVVVLNGAIFRESETNKFEKILFVHVYHVNSI